MNSRRPVNSDRYAPRRIISMSWFKQLFGTDTTRRVTARNPLVIDSPRIAFLNLIGPEADNLLNQDKQALGNLFS